MRLYSTAHALVIMAAKGLLSNSKATVKEALEKILEQEECSYNEELCQNLLTATRTHPELQSKVAEVIASFAKEEEFRGIAQLCGVITSMCPLIASDDRGTQLQTLRAIGNLCFDHDGNRELFLNCGGCPLLVDRLKSVSSLPTEKEFDQLKLVCCGCVLNTVNDNERLCQEVLGLGVLEYLLALLSRPGEDSLTLLMGLQALCALLNTGGSESYKNSTKSLCKYFASILDRCAHSSEDLTNQLSLLLEAMEMVIKDNVSEEVVVELVETGCTEKLSEIGDPKQLLKAIDLLILTCANDEYLKLVAEQKWLFDATMKWLEEPFALDVRANAALLLANMARTDEMCAKLISLGFVPKLIQLTQIEEPEELSGKVHVSALSGLRNLSLPVSHKAELVEKGVLQVALECLRRDQWPHVHFKSLSIARLLSTQQAEVCKELTKPGTVKLICERCPATGEPAHLRIEGSRLLSAVVKHCKSNDVMKTVISEEGVKLISYLLDSTHLALRNESLLALNLLTLLGADEEVRTALTDEAVVGGVWGVVTSDDSSPEIVSNAMTFLSRIAESFWTDNLRQKMVGLKNLKETLKSLTQGSNDAVSNLANQLVKKLSLEDT